MSLEVVPMSLKEAAVFVHRHHRTHADRNSKTPRRIIALFAVAAADAGEVVGVCIVGRPKARMLQDGWTAEVVRLCTTGTRNACSILYAAAWRACRALGWRKLITYTLPEEGGASLRAAGWKCLGEAGGGSWNRKARPRVDLHPMQTKLRWEASP